MTSDIKGDPLTPSVLERVLGDVVIDVSYSFFYYGNTKS
jgi:hypothetical protein